MEIATDNQSDSDSAVFFKRNAIAFSLYLGSPQQSLAKRQPSKNARIHRDADVSEVDILC